MLYWVPAGPSLSLSPRRKPRRVINVLAASSTDGGGPSSWLDSPVEADRHKEEEAGDGGEQKEEKGTGECVSVVGRKLNSSLFCHKKKNKQKNKTLQHFIFYISITSLPRNTQYTCYTPFE